MAATSYKCPSCGASIEYVVTSRMMHCAFCLSQFTPAQVEAAHNPPAANTTPPATAPRQRGRSLSTGEEHRPQQTPQTPSPVEEVDPLKEVEWTEPPEEDLVWTLREGKALSARDKEALSSWECNSCGAHVISDRTLLSTRCGYCNSTLVQSSSSMDAPMPELIIPFSIDRDAMVKAFLESTKGRFLLPRRFKDEALIRQAQGTYVPFWMVEGVITGTFLFSASDTWKERELTKTVTTTDEYVVTRKAHSGFKFLPVCADSASVQRRIPVTPAFTPDAFVPFQGAYLAGYITPNVSVSAEKAKLSAKVEADSEFSSRVRNSVRHQVVSLRRKTTHLTHPTITYTMIPLWFLNIEYRGSTYEYLINGYNGEVTGHYPVSVLQKRSIIGACSAAATVAALWLGDIVTQVVLNMFGV